MDFLQLAIAIFISLALGLPAGLLAWRWHRSRIIKRAQTEAQEILQEAQELKELRDLEEKELLQEIETELWSKHEPEMLRTEGKIEELELLAEEKKQRLDKIINDKKSKLGQVDATLKTQEQKLSQNQGTFESKKKELKSLNEQLTLKLCERLQTDPQSVLDEMKKSLEIETQTRMQKYIELTIEGYKEHAEQHAKNFLDIALNRFARPYCAERGIGAVTFPDEQTRRNFCDPQGNNIKAVQESCGCDIVVEDGMEMIGVAGFDPVRRELTRRTLEKLMKERKAINPDMIRRLAEQIKKDLFRQIKLDGDNIAKELKLQNLHPEIRQMMGSLRYRYSFTQNQYFHCAEVGWLCGLLATELNLNTPQARRSGMLHDIGKSMDHAAEGGHAMIGADFIKARGEQADIVHNVRAHHFDEQPNSDTAFLVIAADAISGARPGARRSTMESYTQKVNELQDISRSFDGVIDCIVLNGGRECRVLVDSRRISDQGALDISRKIALKIEDECNYPGQIKVVVVRETYVTESTFNR